MEDEGYKYTQQMFENPEALKRERRYQLLQAAAVLHANFCGTIEGWSREDSVAAAADLLSRIEAREAK